MCHPGMLWGNFQKKLAKKKLASGVRVTSILVPTTMLAACMRRPMVMKNCIVDLVVRVFERV